MPFLLLSCRASGAADASSSSARWRSFTRVNPPMRWTPAAPAAATGGRFIPMPRPTGQKRQPARAPAADRQPGQPAALVATGRPALEHQHADL